MSWAHVATIAALLLAAALLASGPGGCAHMTPHQTEAATVAVSIGQECVATPLVQCPWTGGPEAFKACAVRSALPCAVEKTGALIAVGLGWLLDRYGVMLAGSVAPVSDSQLPLQILACTDAIDAELVARSCERKSGRLCVAAAVAACVDHATTGAAAMEAEQD